MQITLNHNEIEEAITQFIGNQGIDIADKCTQVSMVAGRGTNGFSATVDITSNTQGKEPIVESAETPPSPPTVEFDEDEPEIATSDDNLFGN